MSRKMTIVFHDEELYTDLKVEAARRHKTASEIVAEAVQLWLEEKEADELAPYLEEAQRDYEAGRTIPWSEVKKEMDEILAKREKLSIVAKKKE